MGFLRRLDWHNCFPLSEGLLSTEHVKMTPDNPKAWSYRPLVVGVSAKLYWDAALWWLFMVATIKGLPHQRHEHILHVEIQFLQKALQQKKQNIQNRAMKNYKHQQWKFPRVVFLLWKWVVVVDNDCIFTFKILSEVYRIHYNTVHCFLMVIGWVFFTY